MATEAGDTGASQEALESRLEATDSPESEAALELQITKEIAEAGKKEQTSEGDDGVTIEIRPSEEEGSKEVQEAKPKEEKPKEEAVDWEAKTKDAEAKTKRAEAALGKSKKAKDFAWRRMGSQSQELHQLRSKKASPRESEEGEEFEEEAEVQIQVERPVRPTQDMDFLQASSDDFFADRPDLIEREEPLLELLASAKSDSEVADCLVFPRGTFDLDVRATLNNINRLYEDREEAEVKEKASEISTKTKKAQDAAISSGGGTPPGQAQRRRAVGALPSEQEMMDNPEKYYNAIGRALTKAGLADSNDPLRT